MRITMLYDPSVQPELPVLPASHALRTTASVALLSGYDERVRKSDPNVVIVDLRGQPDRTIEIVSALRAVVPGANLLVVGAPGALDAAREAIRGGVAGYVTRDASLWGLLAALRAIAEGGLYVSRTSRPAIQRRTDIPT